MTKEEERIYAGKHGWANQICMKILVRLGELFNATKLIPIESAHVSGVSYKTIGDSSAEFLERLADEKVKVKATLNPQSFDLEGLGARLPKLIRKKQLSILSHFEKMGFAQSLTCTPYYLERPTRDSHLAWAESSAVVYANSVLGAWTNREGGPSALAAAIIGKTADYGMHQPENRQPMILVNVEPTLRDKTEFGALGIYLGKILEDKIPIIKGLENASDGKLKQLGAALATTGMVNMFHRNVDLEENRMEKICVEDRDVKDTIEDLTTTSKTKTDLVFTGCPHCSQKEIRRIAMLTQDLKTKDGPEFWVCTSHHVKERVGEYVKKIERSGGRVLKDMCTIVSWTEKLGIKTIMTDSAKTAYYAPTLNKAETVFAPLEQCLKAAFKG